MGRLVSERYEYEYSSQEGRNLHALRVSKDSPSKLNEHLERVAAFIPSEIVAAYLTITNIAIGPGAGQSPLKLGTCITVFALGVIGTPLYFKLLAKPGDAVRTQCIISTIAFIVWAYALAGWISEVGLFYREIAGTALVIFSVVSSIFPRPKMLPSVNPRPLQP